MNNQRVVNAGFDCVVRFKSSKNPLKNVAKDIIAERKLNSGERKILLDLVFSWSRNSNLAAIFFSQKIKYFSTMSELQRLHLVISVLAVRLLDNSFFDEQIISLANELSCWLPEVNNPFLQSLGEVLAQALVKDYGENAENIAQALFEKPSRYLAYDRNKLTKQSVIDALAKLNIKASSHKIAKNALKIEGSFLLSAMPKGIRENIWVMDAGSQIICEFIKPKPDEKVLDMCVGEGGKARFINMQPCLYTALDIDSNRLLKAKKRLFGQNISFICADGTNPPFEDETFDWVLLDAPCSGMGVIRRHPDIIHRISKVDLNKSKNLQHRLLKNAIKLVKPGGKIVYVTCSLLKSENELQIESVTAKNSKIKRLALKTLFDEQVEIFSDELNKFELTLFPHIHDCDGFYLAVLEKTRE